MQTTLTAILVSLACCVVGLVLVIFFEEWKIRDTKKTKKSSKEVDRLLSDDIDYFIHPEKEPEMLVDLDEYEQKIS